MKNLFKTLPIVLVTLTLVSCDKKQDWTCVCQYPLPEDSERAPWIDSVHSIIDVKEKEAKTICDTYDSNLLGFTWDCALEE